jgi:hypothetical protein
MNKTNLITLLANLILQVNDRRGNLPLGSPEKKKWGDLRKRLHKQLLKLAEIVLDENTAAYATATKELKTINTEIEGSIVDVNKTAQTFASLAKLAAAIDDLLKIAVKVSAG